MKRSCGVGRIFTLGTEATAAATPVLVRGATDATGMPHELTSGVLRALGSEFRAAAEARGASFLNASCCFIFGMLKVEWNAEFEFLRGKSPPKRHIEEFGRSVSS